MLATACGGQEEPVAPTRTASSMSGTGAQTAAVSADAYYPALQQIYIAYFGRPADPGGLAFYAKNLAASGAPTDLRALLDSATPDTPIRALLDTFGNSAESKALYGTDTTAFLTSVYRNVLGRTPDRDGLSFWKKNIDSGAVPPAIAAIWILTGATTPGNTDGDLIRVKLAAATAFTGAMKSTEQAGAYAGPGAILRARSYLSALSTDQDLSLLPGAGERVVDELVMTAHPGKVIFRGTVALGNPVKDAWVQGWDQDGLLGDVKSLADGTYLLSTDLARKLRPPIVFKAEFTALGKKFNLFSISTDDNGRNATMNITPVTDMITRAYVPAPNLPNLEDKLVNEPSRLESIKDTARKVFGPLLSSNTPDPISAYMVADPKVNKWDALLEKLVFTPEATQTTIASVDGKVIATVPDAELVSGNVSDPVNSVEAFRANQARGPLTEPVTPHVNTETTPPSPTPTPTPTPGALPAPTGFTAAATGGLKFRLKWNQVPGADRYYVYQQKNTPPTVKPGTYQNGQLVPTMATGGNSEADVDWDYQVDGPGLYYWVIVAVSDKNQTTTFTLGQVANPVSLNFSEPAPAGTLTADSPCSEWRKVITGRQWTITEHVKSQWSFPGVTGGTLLVRADNTMVANGPPFAYDNKTFTGTMQIGELYGRCRYYQHTADGQSMSPFFMWSYENGKVKVSYSSGGAAEYFILQ